MNIIVFEDQDYRSLFPININRASFELRCGSFTNLERIINSISSDDKIQLIVRDTLIPIVKERYPNLQINPKIIEKGVFLNGRGIWNNKIIKRVLQYSPITFANKGLTMAFSTSETLALEKFDNYLQKTSLVTSELDIHAFHNIWDGIFFQSEVMNEDREFFVKYNGGKIHPSVVIENDENIFINRNAEVRAGAIIDARYGPVIIDDSAFIDIGALIQGPVYIGPNTIINPGAKLRKNITLGPMCKIGGEIEDVIFQGFSNKQHDGFIGHSYIGEWVNLGANTNNSDLKNNYNKIKIIIEDKIIDTNRNFLGTLIGDYSRTGISTMLNTGTIIGFGVNIFGAGFQEKYIPSFQWGKNEITNIDKLISTIETMKKRRNEELSSSEREFIKIFYKK